MYFGLATEGVTDQAVLSNILIGHFSDTVDDIDDNIAILQPLFDETTLKQKGFGNWNLLLEYLKDKRFREDVINHNFIVVQIDTDVSESPGFDVPTTHNGIELSISEFIQNVEDRLIQEINVGKENFHIQHAEKIIFCITVHSIECWINCYYERERSKLEKIVHCENTLMQRIANNPPRNIERYEKTYSCYNLLSSPYRRKKNIMSASKHNESFSLFIDKIEQINIE